VAASGYRADSKLIAPAMQAFQRAAALPGAGAAPLSALVVVAGHMHRPVEEQWWRGIADALRAQPPSAESIGALESLITCQREKHCPQQTAELLGAYAAALEHPPSGRLLADYGVFAANQLGDYAVAENALSDAATALPEVAQIRINLAKVLIVQGRLAEGRRILDGLEPRQLNHSEEAQWSALRTASEAAVMPPR